MPAGTWHLVADGIITASIDVEFDILWRRTGTPDVTVVSWMHHFDPKPNGDFTATAYEDTGAGTAIDFKDGDQLVFRYSGSNAPPNVAEAYVPDGDGAKENGRIPYIDLPQ